MRYFTWNAGARVCVRCTCISDGAFGGEEENERFAKIMNGERLLSFCLNRPTICLRSFALQISLFIYLVKDLFWCFASAYFFAPKIKWHCWARRRRHQKSDFQMVCVLLDLETKQISSEGLKSKPCQPLTQRRYSPKHTSLKQCTASKSLHTILVNFCGTN